MSDDRAAGLHHRRVERHRPGAGARASTRAGYRLALVARRADEVAALGARRRASTPATLRGLRRRRARRRRDHRRRPAPASQRQGVPDVVIANAGISVGIDTADAATISR